MDEKQKSIASEILSNNQDAPGDVKSWLNSLFKKMNLGLDGRQIMADYSFNKKKNRLAISWLFGSRGVEISIKLFRDVGQVVSWTALICDLDQEDDEYLLDINQTHSPNQLISFNQKHETWGDVAISIDQRMRQSERSPGSRYSGQFV